MKRSHSVIPILFFSILFVAFFYDVNILEDLSAPFLTLKDRVLLLGYLNFIALCACLLVFPFLIICGMYSFVTMKKPSPKVWKYFYIAFFVGFLCIIPRYHLGTRIDNAGYVKCTKESRTSATSSWRVYAKSIDLCKESSGIAGG